MRKIYYIAIVPFVAWIFAGLVTENLPEWYAKKYWVLIAVWAVCFAVILSSLAMAGRIKKEARMEKKEAVKGFAVNLFFIAFSLLETYPINPQYAATIAILGVAIFGLGAFFAKIQEIYEELAEAQITIWVLQLIPVSLLLLPEIEKANSPLNFTFAAMVLFFSIELALAEARIAFGKKIAEYIRRLFAK